MAARWKDTQITPPPESAKPPSFVARYGPVLAMVVGCLTLLGLILGNGDGRWETRAHAQEVSATQAAVTAAKVEVAKEECRKSLEATVTATRSEMVQIRERLVRVETSQQRTEAMLAAIANKLNVILVPAPQPAPVQP